MDLDESCCVERGVKDLVLGGSGGNGREVGKSIGKLSGRLPWGHVYHCVCAGLISDSRVNGNPYADFKELATGVISLSLTYLSPPIPRCRSRSAFASGASPCLVCSVSSCKAILATDISIFSIAESSLGVSPRVRPVGFSSLFRLPIDGSSCTSRSSLYQQLSLNTASRATSTCGNYTLYRFFIFGYVPNQIFDLYIW